MVIFTIWKKIFLLLLIISTTELFLSAEDPISAYEVVVSIDSYNTVQDKPVPGTITITHNATETIDPQSFILAGKPLRAEFVKEVSISPGLIISIYRFELPAQPAGLYSLPSVSVKVGGKTLNSLPTSYQVSAIQFQQVNEASKAVVFTLSAQINGPPIVYPGHRLWFIYRFSYNGNVELTSESLPLLDAKGFKIIGDKQIKNYQEGENSIQEVSQQVQAVNPGQFSFPSSSAEGYAYIDSGAKKRTYVKPKLMAEAPALKVVVIPFPEKGRPSNFQDALGEYTIQTSLLGSSEVNVDEKMLLAINISGEGELSTIKLPDISNLKQLFRISSIPASEKIEGNTKRFVIEIFPLSKAVTSVPGISFSFFDPILGQYTTVKSPPIPISIKNGPQSQSTPTMQKPQQLEQTQETESLAPFENPKVEPGFYSPDIEPFFTKPENENKVPTLVKPPQIEIEKGQPLANSDLHNLPFGTWWSLLLIPLAIVIVLGQIMFKKKRQHDAQIVNIDKSNEIFKQALDAADVNAFYQLISHALLLKLFEKGNITSPDMDAEALDTEGNQGIVKAFLMEINADRFGKGSLAIDQLKTRAKTIFDLLS